MTDIKEWMDDYRSSLLQLYQASAGSEAATFNEINKRVLSKFFSPSAQPPTHPVFISPTHRRINPHFKVFVDAVDAGAYIAQGVFLIRTFNKPDGETHLVYLGDGPAKHLAQKKDQYSQLFRVKMEVGQFKIKSTWSTWNASEDGGNGWNFASGEDVPYQQYRRPVEVIRITPPTNEADLEDYNEDIPMWARR